MGMPELVFAPSAPFPILGASAEWCAMLGAKEEDCKGCGFKAFDSDLFPLTQSKVAAVGGCRDNLSDEVTAAMSVALEQRRPVYVSASLELDEERAAAASCPPKRKVSLKVEPVYEGFNPDQNALPSASKLRLTLQEQDIISVKDAMDALKSGRAMVLSNVGAPHRIAKVSHFWKDTFGLDEAGSVGRSLKMIEGPLTQEGVLRSLYEGVSSGVAVEGQLTSYHMDGRPHVNHLRVVPVKGELPASKSSPMPPQPRTDSLAAAAAAAGVTHCLWYMDLHEAVTDKVAMSEVFYPGCPKVMTTATAPFSILDVNATWCEACVLDRSDVLGKSLALLQGPATEKVSTKTVCEDTLGFKASSSHLINYRGDGVPFVNNLKTHPVIDDRTGVVKGAIGVLHQSMSAALESALDEAAKAALVLSATYPHTIVHANKAWLDVMVADFMKRDSSDQADAFIGRPLSSLALVAARPDDTSVESDCDDLMRLSQGGKQARLLVARHDIMAGCGEWLDAALAPVLDVSNPTSVNYLILSLDLTLAPKGTEPHTGDKVAAQVASSAKAPALAPILRRTNEAPVPSLLDSGEEEYLGVLEAERAVGKRAAGLVDPLQPCPQEQEEVVDRDIGRSLHARRASAGKPGVPKAPLPRSCELPCDTFEDGDDGSNSEEDGDTTLGDAAKLDKEASVEVPWVPLSQRQAPRAAPARSAGLLERTSALDDVPGRSAAAPAVILPRTCEESPDTMSGAECEMGGVLDDDADEDEEYMDSEEEHELMGCRLPPDEVKASLEDWLAQRRARGDELEEEEEAECPEANPTNSVRGESEQALKQRTMMLSDQELFQAIADHAPERYHRSEQREDRWSDLDETSTEEVLDQGAESDDDDDVDIAFFRKSTAQSPGGKRKPDDGSKVKVIKADCSYRDASGSLWKNSAVFTTVRVQVQDGVAVAPIYDEYLKILSDKGFVETWEWPADDVLSLQVPYGRVEKATRKSAWCAKHAPDLMAGHDWWTRLRYLVAIIQLNAREKERGGRDSGSTKGQEARETIMMPRGSVTRDERNIGLGCLRKLGVICSWSWDNDDAVAVVVDSNRLRAACVESRWCNKWAPISIAQGTPDLVEGWGIYWLRLVWLTSHQPAFVAAVAPGDIQLDLVSQSTWVMPS